MLEKRAERRFDFHYYLDQPIRKDSNVYYQSVTAPRLLGVDEEIGSNYFSPNFYSGGGWKLWQNQFKKYNLMIDNLFVRGTMTLWELIINQLRAHNGTVIIGSTGKTKEGGYKLDAGTSYHLWFDSEDSDVDLQPFAVNDIIMAKRFKMNNDGAAPTVVYEIYGTVSAISVGGEHNKITFDTAGSPNVPGDANIPQVLEFVRIGNTTDTSRQGLIVLTSDGIDSGGSATVPYIDVYNGIDSRAKFLDKDYVTVRLGRLDEITGGTNEFGLWGSVVHLSGSGGSGWGITLEGSGDPATAGYAAADYTDGTLYWDYTNKIYYLLVSGSWTIMAGGIGEDGDLGIPASPSGTGLYASGDYLGFYADSDWRGYWLNSGADAGDFFLKGASDTCLWWDYSDASLYIGGTSAGDAYLKTSAGAGNIEFWDTAGVNVLGIGSNLDGGNNSGITLREKGFIYKHNDSNNAVSTLHSELYNQTTNYIGGISTLVSTTSDGSTPSLSTDNLICGTKSMAYATGSYNATGGQFHGKGNTSGILYGTYCRSINAGSGNAYGIYAAASGYGTTNIGVYGTALYATTNWAGYFQAGNVLIANYLRVGGLTNSTSSAYGIKFGLGEDTNLYRGAANVLKTDDNFYVAQQLRFDSGTTSADGLLWGSDVNLYRSAANVLKTDDAFNVVGRFYPSGGITIDNSSIKFDTLPPSSDPGVNSDTVYTALISGHHVLCVDI